MASISGVSGSNTTSSLYNSANVISGLASGLDTESMIENLVQSYQTKIQSINNKVTKIEWKQEAYRSIISKMYAFSNKYTSYASSTNLMSTSFFNNAINVASMGANKDKVTASGRTDSDIQVSGVKQLATSARYSTASNLKGADNSFDITAENPVKFDDQFDMGTLSGSLTLTYGGQTVSVVFDPNTDMISNDLSASEKAEELSKMIKKKLGDSQITLSTGETKAASDLIDVQCSGGKITFKDKSTGGNNVYISDASTSVASTLGLDLEDADENKPNSIQLSDSTRLTKSQEVGTFISGASMNVSLDGKVKSIQLPEVRKTYDDDGNAKYEMKDANGQYVALTGDNYAAAVQSALDKEYGAGKIKVTNEGGADAMQLKFQAPNNSDLIINSDVGKALGIGNIATNYLNTSKTLGELMDDSAWDGLSVAKAVGTVTIKDGKKVDQAGNLVNDNGNIVDNNGNELYAFKVNGVDVGYYNKDTKLSTVMSDLNTSNAGVKVSYSQTTRKFTFTSKDTGSENGIELGDGLAQTMFGASGSVSNNFSETFGLGLGDGESKVVTFNVPGSELSVRITNEDTMEDVAQKMNATLSFFGYTASYNKTSGQLIVADKTGKAVDLKATADGAELEPQYTSTYTPGRDAVFAVEINGDKMEMTRGSNSFSLDGMTLNLKGTFNTDAWDTSSGEFDWDSPSITEAVSFQRTTDSDKIIDAIKSMISDYNEMMSEIRTQYATLPYQNSSGAFQTYEPLTDEDKATMSESAIQKYEEKAKQGLLFGDRDLRSLYEKMSSIFTPGGTDQTLLNQMGIGVSYGSDGAAVITLDENKMRTVLDNDPDMVTDMFTRSMSSGAASDGIMQQMKSQLDRYGSTTGATKGILVEQAGTPLSSLTLMNNYWQKQIDNYNNEITKWQDKLSAQVDKYTSMFSKLEVLINQMNSQSSTLAGLMGGSY